MIINFLKQELDQFITFFKIQWQKVLVWRLSVFVYRLGEMLEKIILVSMWIFIYGSSSGMIKGYSMEEMVTYVLIGGLFSAMSFNLIWGTVSRDIERGDLSLFLVKPVSYIKYQIYTEFGGWALNILASILAQSVVIFLFIDKIIINTDFKTLSIISIMIFLTIFIEVLIGLLVGFIAFWSEGEVGGFHNLSSIIRKFFAGVFFPLSLLPTSLSFIGFYLPFAYSFFVPAQIYLGKMSMDMAWKGIVIQLVWILILSILVKIVWKKGLKKYEAVGA